MPYLIAAVVLVSALGLLNLLLNLAMIRRLREHTELLAKHAAIAGGGIIQAGQSPGDFLATDSDGREVRRSDLVGEVLVGFFSTNCPACTDALPTFVTWATGLSGGRSKVFAVVNGEEPAAADLAAKLAGAARVIVEHSDSAIITAFQVAAFPSWCRLDDGTVRDSGTGLSRAPSLVTG
ncbi:peroxiredoxin family protein [Micromonospora palomenae]|uniref:peroxiredoxin family protein n=1 Tax=Micromonospora palomenae TaxID=1461247 RepID=UPI003F89CEFE